MPRIVELGRAVLASPNARLQLWLTTLINVSQQQSTKLEQLTQHDVLKYLASKDPWVCRGNGMHLALELTVQGEVLEYTAARELVERISKARVRV